MRTEISSESERGQITYRAAATVDVRRMILNFSRFSGGEAKPLPSQSGLKTAAVSRFA
ncbi:MAG: hypothetical protein LBI61_02305 [Puniceicoccales bacterium]|nr:hypothetical protein [Puniceicoccales bacterium]